MKFSTTSILASALFASNAMASKVSLYAESSDSEIKKSGLNALHEGAGFNYVFVNDGSSTQELNYDKKSKTLSLDSGKQKQNFYIADGVAQIGFIEKSTEVTFDKDGYLQIDGSSEGFYGCKNIKDPYNYSEKSYALVYQPKATEGCIELKVKSE